MGDTYTVERSTTIAAPPTEVYSHVIDFHNWGSWSPWEDLDPNMNKTFSGAESGVGAKYAWTGNRKAGQGSMEITDAKDNSEVQIALEFLKPFKASNTIVLKLAPEGGGTKVSWTMIGKNTLMTRVMGIFKSMDAMVGPDFEKGLSRLKAVSEQ